MEGVMATILMFAGNFAPKNWVFCQGQLMAIQTNTALFSLLGTTYGGDGRTTFGIPDLRGRVPVGVGQGPGLPSVALGQMAGVPQITLNANQIPAHTHSLSVPTSSANGSFKEPDGNILSATAGNQYAPVGAADGTYGGVTATGITGSSAPVNIMNPYLGMNYVICQYGIFPSRN